MHPQRSRHTLPSRQAHTNGHTHRWAHSQREAGRWAHTRIGIERNREAGRWEHTGTSSDLIQGIGYCVSYLLCGMFVAHEVTGLLYCLWQTTGWGGSASEVCMPVSWGWGFWSPVASLGLQASLGLVTWQLRITKARLQECQVPLDPECELIQHCACCKPQGQDWRKKCSPLVDGRKFAGVPGEGTYLLGDHFLLVR